MWRKGQQYILFIEIYIFHHGNSGESYAGIYVPTLVNTIREMNMKAPANEVINLKGFMVRQSDCQLEAA